MFLSAEFCGVEVQTKLEYFLWEQTALHSAADDKNVMIVILVWGAKHLITAWWEEAADKEASNQLVWWWWWWGGGWGCTQGLGHLSPATSVRVLTGFIFLMGGQWSFITPSAFWLIPNVSSNFYDLNAAASSTRCFLSACVCSGGIWEQQSPCSFRTISSVWLTLAYCCLLKCWFKY